MKNTIAAIGASVLVAATPVGTAFAQSAHKTVQKLLSEASDAMTRAADMQCIAAAVPEDVHILSADREDKSLTYHDVHDTASDEEHDILLKEHMLSGNFWGFTKPRPLGVDIVREYGGGHDIKPGTPEAKIADAARTCFGKPRQIAVLKP